MAACLRLFIVLIKNENDLFLTDIILLCCSQKQVHPEAAREVGS
jgi:hypothetical protein